MKNTLIILLMFFLVCSCSCVDQGTYSDLQQPAAEEQGHVSFQVFYDDLSPYGEWVNDPDYGYVWIPGAGPDFVPYSTSGHWVMTEYGWMWLSDYKWGWAPFHYGRWDYDSYRGWFWIPGDEWGPAWVVWRSGGGYYGWAPMRPGISVEMSLNSESRDPGRWNFVREKDFDRENPGKYYINRRDNEQVIRNTKVINNTYADARRNVTYVAGPSPNEVQNTIGRKIPNVAVLDNNRPGQKISNRQVQIYRPQFENQTRTRPPKVIDSKDIHPEGKRNNNIRQNNVMTQPPPIRQRHPENKQNQQTEEMRHGQQQYKIRHHATYEKQNQPGNTQHRGHNKNPQKKIQPEQKGRNER